MVIRKATSVGIGLMFLAAAGCEASDSAENTAAFTVERSGDVFAGFDLQAPATGPFPSDIFTVDDASHNTGRRLNYPHPDCSVHVSDCEDIDVVNTLDGWGLQSRVSVPFSDDIDPNTVTSDSLFIVRLPDGARIGINQRIWDPSTHTMHVEVDAMLEQHRRYAVIVTKDVLDTQGHKVKKTPAFESYATTAPAWYASQLDQALAAAHAGGTPPGQVVTASVFTTQTITSVMERIRDQVKAGTPAPADFVLGTNGERAVFARNEVSSIAWRQQTRVSPPGFTTSSLVVSALDNIPGAVGTIAFGRFNSPEYLVHPGEYIPAVGTLAGTPPVQAITTQYFTLFLPSGPRPSNGWPVALVGTGAAASQHQTSFLIAAGLAAHGIASIGINHVGQGFGPLGTLTVNKTNGSSTVVADGGRGIDQNGDNVIATAEGSDAAGTRNWTIQQRDAHRQTVIDFMQLVRVVEVGMDVDGDSTPDLDPSRIYFAGNSAGPMIGTILLALDPSIAVGAFSSTPGLVQESVRWQPLRRGAIGANLARRTPSLINANGLTSIDGVPTVAPFFNENKPLRDQPIVVNTVAGAIALQQALEFAELVEESGLSPAMWARYIRREPLAGSYPKAVIYQFARGDQQATNPGTTALLREGQLEDRATFYRHDLAFASDHNSPAMPKNPHTFLTQANSANPTSRAVGLGAQDQFGAFFESNGTITIHPEPAQFFEVPIAGPLPETLSFIP